MKVKVYMSLRRTCGSSLMSTFTPLLVVDSSPGGRVSPIVILAILGSRVEDRHPAMSWQDKCPDKGTENLLLLWWSVFFFFPLSLSVWFRVSIQTGWKYIQQLRWLIGNSSTILSGDQLLDTFSERKNKLIGKNLISFSLKSLPKFASWKLCIL